MITVAAVVLVAIAGAVVLISSGTLANARSCASYPVPGTPAAAGARVSSRLTRDYALLDGSQDAADRLTARQVASLQASGLIMSGTRFLGDAALGGRIYLVPAEHLLSMPLAPARCLTPLQRVIERASRPVLQAEYRQAGLCLVVLYPSLPRSDLHDCSPVAGSPYALLSTAGTPGFGLVPNGVDAVTVTYQFAPPRTLTVHHNFFVILAPHQAAPPCGVQWLDPTGNVIKIAVGCSYVTVETHELAAYRAYVAARLRRVRSQVDALADAIRSGPLAGARSAWLAAHLTWLQIGQDDGAYGCFGALGGEIDGLAAGHPRGTSDPGFTGFHRVELDLWTRRDRAAAAADTATLKALLGKLVRAPLTAYLPATPTGLGNWLLRPHEVLEDALRDSLTADDDYGSATDLASLDADVAAVRTLLHELAPLLGPVAPHLVTQARAELAALTAAIGVSRADRSGIPISALAVRDRQQIDADTDAALETLAPIPDLLTSTGSNSPSD